jgi:hypothetical protein
MRTYVRMAESWKGPAPLGPDSYVCCKCGGTIHMNGPEKDYGVSFLKAGRRCGTCTRAYYARVDARAREIVVTHRDHRWAGRTEHSESDECLWCDVHRRASEIALWTGGAQLLGSQADRFPPWPHPSEQR